MAHYVINVAHHGPIESDIANTYTARYVKQCAMRDRHLGLVTVDHL